MWFRRKQPVSAPFDASKVPNAVPASLEHLVSEGLMLAEFAGRMTLKNQIVIGALTEPGPYEADRYRDAARGVLTDMIRMSEDSAALAVEQLEAAAERQGASQHEHDYRQRDAENLRRRESVNTAVAERLQAMRDDPQYVARFIERAREDAWGDVGSAIASKLDRKWPALPVPPDDEGAERPADDSDRKRRRRTRRLQRDLARLVREHERFPEG